MALFRAAAAAGLLLALAPEQTREALSAIFLGAEAAQKALPTREEAVIGAMRLCSGKAETCAALARGAAETGQKLRP